MIFLAVLLHFYDMYVSPAYLQSLFISNVLLVLVSGTGLMCSMSSKKKDILAVFVDGYFIIDINNFSSMSQCLYAYNNSNYDVMGSGWQAA